MLMKLSGDYHARPSYHNSVDLKSAVGDVPLYKGGSIVINSDSKWVNTNKCYPLGTSKHSS